MPEKSENERSVKTYLMQPDLNR